MRLKRLILSTQKLQYFCQEITESHTYVLGGKSKQDGTRLALVRASTRLNDSNDGSNVLLGTYNTIYATFLLIAPKFNNFRGRTLYFFSEIKYSTIYYELNVEG